MCGVSSGTRSNVCIVFSCYIYFTKNKGITECNVDLVDLISCFFFPHIDEEVGKIYRLRTPYSCILTDPGSGVRALYTSYNPIWKASKLMLPQVLQLAGQGEASLGATCCNTASAPGPMMCPGKAPQYKSRPPFVL